MPCSVHDLAGFLDPTPRSQPHSEWVGTLNVNPVSDPGCPQLSTVALQEDRSLGGVEPLCLQEQLEAAGLRPMQVVIEGELKQKTSLAARALWHLNNQEGQSHVSLIVSHTHLTEQL